MKVAIWGSYDHGNYGDDVMAIQFAEYLKSLNTKPIVYRLDARLAALYNIQTTQSLAELFDGAAFCIIGGGGMLVDQIPPEFESDFRALYLTATETHCPVFPISIGGQGRRNGRSLSLWRQKFFEAGICPWATVRLEEDVELLQDLNQTAYFYPDVLLSVAQAWNIPKKTNVNERLQIGINFPDSPQCRLLALQLFAIATIRQDIDFHFIQTYLPNSSSSELLPKFPSACIKHHIYSDPRTTLEFLASLDLLVSYKLHLGLTALALGVPFLNVGGPNKVRTFLKSIDAEFAYWPAQTKRLKLAALLANPDNVCQFSKKFNFDKIEQHAEQSLGHMERLKQAVFARV